MFSILAISLAAVAVSAQYGANTANDAAAPVYQKPTYSNGPIYYPPVVFDAHYYWDYDSREHRQRQCPRIQTYLPTLPGFPEATFYPPVIRYARYGGQLNALIVCDQNPKNINLLFVRRNSSLDVRTSHLAAAGTTAGVVAECNRRDRRFFGPVLNFTETPSFTSEVKVAEVACMGLDKFPFFGLLVDKQLEALAPVLATALQAATIETRRKREADTGAETTTVAAAAEAETTTAAAAVAAETTTAAAVVAETTAAAAETETASLPGGVDSAVAQINLADGLSPEEAALIKDPATAIQVGLAGIGKILASIF